MKHVILGFCICFSLACPGLAQVMVVSDIDDTLKISNILDKVDAAENVPLVQNHFLGMSDVLRALQNGPEGQAQFFYVSNAPEHLMGHLHDRFLAYNQFPEGPTYLRVSPWEMDHKYKTISSLIDKHRPLKVVLLGDNGEQDTVIYSRIRKDFLHIPMKIFIHQVYSVKSQSRKGKPLEFHQLGFATSVDLAGELKKLSLISEVAYQQIIETLVPRILREREDLMSGEVAFPAWMDCRDVVFASVDPDLELLKEYDSKARHRCSKPRFR